MNTHERYVKALAQIQMAGVVVLENYPTCCTSCAYHEIAEMGLKDVIFFISEQGRALSFDDKGRAQHWDWAWDDVDEDKITGRNYWPATHLYWGHLGENAARITASNFRDVGFEVDWDGDKDLSPLVKLV